MPHGEWLIPDDWNPETGKWEHYCIEWPKSFLWYIQLKSLMFALTRGREWDENSGTITTAQAIGWEIFKRNHLLLNLCGDQDGSPEPQNGLSGAFDGMEGYEMPCIDLSSLVKIENGHLYVKDSCCVWVDIGAIAGVNESVPDDPLNPTGDPDYLYSACGKAKAVVDAVYKIVEAGFSAAGEPYPWQIIPYIEDAVGYDLDNNNLIPMMAEIAAGILLSMSFADVNDAVERQKILCRVVNEFDDDAIGVPTSEKYEAIRGCFKAEMFPFEPWWPMFDHALQALGRVDMNTIAMFGAGSTGEDCDCPAETPAEPFADYGLDKAWKYVYDFRTGENGFTLGSNTRQNGTGLWAVNQVSDHIAAIGAELPFDNVNNGSTIELIGLIWQNMGDENYMISGTDVGTDDDEFIDQPEVISLGGNNPATAGTFTYIVSTSTPLGTGATEFHANLQAEHLTDVSQRLIAVMFAGSGPGPMTP